MFRHPSQMLMFAAVLGLGYLWGRNDANSAASWTKTVVAQDDNQPAEETQRKIQLANDALKTAMEALKAESLYTPATRGMNVFGVLTGGIDAIDDLESGRGVDPETFAGLYADQANDEVLPHLGKDEEGRLTYKNKLVRLYPISRLKRLQSKRMLMTGEIQRTRTTDE